MFTEAKKKAIFLNKSGAETAKHFHFKRPWCLCFKAAVIPTQSQKLCLIFLIHSINCHPSSRCIHLKAITRLKSRLLKVEERKPLTPQGSATQFSQQTNIAPFSFDKFQIKRSFACMQLQENIPAAFRSWRPQNRVTRTQGDRR